MKLLVSDCEAEVQTEDVRVVFDRNQFPAYVRLLTHEGEDWQPSAAYCQNGSKRVDKLLERGGGGCKVETGHDVSVLADHALGHFRASPHTHLVPLAVGCITPQGIPGVEIDMSRYWAISSAIRERSAPPPLLAFRLRKGPGYTQQEHEALLSLGHKPYKRYEPVVIRPEHHVHIGVRLAEPYNTDEQSLHEVLPVQRHPQSRYDTVELTFRVLEEELGIRSGSNRPAL